MPSVLSVSFCLDVRLQFVDFTMASFHSLLTAEEYASSQRCGDHTELVRGRIVDVPYTDPRNGEICANVMFLLGRFLETNNIGRLVSNHSPVITRRNPDTVRGIHVAFYSYKRVPKGPLSWAYLPIAPDLVFEVRSPNDRWRKLHAKVGEYLGAGVRTVCVVDDETKSIHAFHEDKASQVFEEADEFSVPGVLEGFQVPVRRFFE